MLAWASGRLNPFIKLLKNNAFYDMVTSTTPESNKSLPDYFN